MSLQGQDLEKAADMAQKAVKLDSLNPANMDTFGWVLFRQQQYGEAQKWIRKAIDNTVKPDADLFEHMGDACYKLNNKSEALEYWQKALQLNDKSEILKKKVKDKKYYEK